MGGTLVSTIIGGGLGLMGASDQASAASGAAANQAASANYAANLQYQEFLQAQQNQQPWLNVGGGALNQLAMMMGIPGYYGQQGQSQGQTAPSQGQAQPQQIQPQGQSGPNQYPGQQMTPQQYTNWLTQQPGYSQGNAGNPNMAYYNSDAWMTPQQYANQTISAQALPGTSNATPAANAPANATPQTWGQFLNVGGNGITPSNLTAAFKAFDSSLPANEASGLQSAMSSFLGTQDPYNSGKTWGQTMQGTPDISQTQAEQGIQSFLRTLPANQAQQYQQQLNSWMQQPAPSNGGNYMAAQNPQFGSLTAPFNYQKSPGYQWQLGQGQQAVEAAQAAGGKFFSGGTGEALINYSQGLAQQDYSNAFNQWLAGNTQQYNELAGLSGTGQISAQQVGQAGQNYAQNAGNFLTQGAQNAGQFNMNAANATAGGYQNLNNQMKGGIGALNNQNIMNTMMGYSSMGNPNAFMSFLSQNPNSQNWADIASNYTGW